MGIGLAQLSVAHHFVWLLSAGPNEKGQSLSVGSVGIEPTTEGL
jgi:hypothetical protein